MVLIAVARAHASVLLAYQLDSSDDQVSEFSSEFSTTRPAASAAGAGRRPASGAKAPQGYSRDALRGSWWAQIARGQVAYI